VDTFTALASGAYALSENYLYTLEALNEFLDHLTDDGVLSFSRWLFTPPRETLRLAVTARVALEKRGVTNPERNIVVIAGHRGNDKPWAETLIKLEPFSAKEMTDLHRWADALQFDVIYDPLVAYAPGGVYDTLESTFHFDPIFCAQEFSAALRASSDEFDEHLRAHGYNITPSIDDAPFFFNFYRLKSLARPLDHRREKGGYSFTRWPLGLVILFTCLIQVVILSIVLILLPMRKRLNTLPWHPSMVNLLVYFACIGLAFIAVEIMLIQKLMVFLGGPVYSMGVTLFSLLVFCGLGSFMARRLTRENLRRSGTIILLGVAILIVMTLWFLNHVVPNLMGLSHPLRCLVAVISLMPVGLLMGMPFPTGIRMAERLDARLVPWAWCVNACATVLGSVASILAAMFLGFTMVFYLCALTYLAALLAIFLAPWLRMPSVRAALADS
jgi:hypothetical protein